MKASLYFSIVFLCLVIIGCSDVVDTPNQPLQPDVSVEYDYKSYVEAGINTLITSPVIIDDIIVDSFFPSNGAPRSPEEMILFPASSTDIVVDNDKAKLGRVLFYDVALSLNNTVACGSCHLQEFAFADNKAVSHGFENKLTSRNASAIVNSSFNNNLFWDSRASSVEELVLKPVENHIEMGMEDFSVLEEKLANIDYYEMLFFKAYNTTNVTADRIQEALTQFLSSMLTFNSKFDKGLEQDFANYTDMERLGMELFFSERTNCTGCHSNKNFAANDFPGGEYGGTADTGTETRGGANVGLDVVYADQGIDNGRFKIPSLRNVALTGPYMHDGRFRTLKEVITHYSDNVQMHEHLDDKLVQGNTPRRMNLSGYEKEAMIAFLVTLTDESFIQDEKFSNPFK